MVRLIVFCIGLALMVVALTVPAWPDRLATDRWHGWLYRLGLLLAVAAHGWPEGL